MAKHFGLGRGLDALLELSEKQPVPRGAGDLFIPLDKIAPNPEQPRKTFTEEALEELALSIKRLGVQEPIIVEETSGDVLNGGSYTIVAGERRWRAAKRAGLTEIPALVRVFTPRERLAVTIVENIQREDLNAIEEAAAYKNLIDLTGMSQDEAAEMLGTNRSTLANALRLLRLPQDMQSAIAEGRMSAGHARAVLSLENEEARRRLFLQITAEGLNVREAERRAAAFSAGGEPESALEPPPPAKVSIKDVSPASARPRDPNLDAMEQQFIEALGTKVRIDGTFEGGVIKIDYFSAADLDRLYALFLK